MRVDKARELARRRGGPWKRPHFIDDYSGDPERGTQDTGEAGKLDGVCA